MSTRTFAKTVMCSDVQDALIKAGNETYDLYARGLLAYIETKVFTICVALRVYTKTNEQDVMEWLKASGFKDCTID